MYHFLAPCRECQGVLPSFCKDLFRTCASAPSGEKASRQGTIYGEQKRRRETVEPKERLILALDVDSADTAVRLVERLSPSVGAFKVGLELVNAAGFGVFSALKSAGAERIFYDAKLHDIPNTVAGA